MSETTITIPWSDRETYNRHKVAVEVQDAGNLRALAREFVKVVDSADDELKSTKAVWEDPAVVLFVNKFESLCRSEARFGEVYAACVAKTRVPDLRVRNEGTICLLTPVSDAGRAWCAEHIPQDAIRWGQESIVVERRFMDDIVIGATNDGLEVI